MAFEESLVGLVCAASKIIIVSRVRVRFLQTPDLPPKRNDGGSKGVATDGSEQDAPDGVQVVEARAAAS